MERNDTNNNGKRSKFIKSTKSISSTPHSGATSLTPIAYSFMYREKCGKNKSDGIFCCFERTDFIQISNITFSYNRFS